LLGVGVVVVAGQPPQMAVVAVLVDIELLLELAVAALLPKPH
jgi:hypothetical protein